MTNINNRNLNKLVEQVEQWSIDKGLDKSDSSKQALKFYEEAGEVAGVGSERYGCTKDGIGDTIVTLIILAQQEGTDIAECLEVAYNEIKGRTGKMVAGVFVKEEDLK